MAEEESVFLDDPIVSSDEEGAAGGGESQDEDVLAADGEDVVVPPCTGKARALPRMGKVNYALLEGTKKDGQSVLYAVLSISTCAASCAVVTMHSSLSLSPPPHLTSLALPFHTLLPPCLQSNGRTCSRSEG
jgi:hypothetical protein